MAAKDQAVFTLHFELSSGLANKWASNPNPRFRFWGPYFTSPPSEPPAWSDLEDRILLGEFASALAERISRGAGTRSRKDIESSNTQKEDRSRLSRGDFSFTVVGPIRYGSAEIAVLLEGVRRVSEAFDNNFELFRIALETYAPEAWNEAVDASVPLSCVLKDDQSLRAAFAPGVSAAAVPDTPGETEKARRLRWLWIASNTSLILPCLLAFAVLYVASQHVLHLEAEVSTRTSHITAREAELVKAYQTRERDLHGALVEVIKSANATALGHTCCCPGAPQPKKQAPTPTACMKSSNSASAPKS